MNKKGLMLDDEQLNEKFASKKQQGYFYARCNDKKLSKKERNKWCKMADEFSSDMSKKDWKKLPEKKDSVDESQIINLIKKEENPRMSKKQLVEYIKNKTKKVVKKVTKDELVNESRDGRNFDPNLWPDFNEAGVKKELMQYLEALRRSGVINMFGAYPILNWTRDDLERWLYGQSKDLESLRSEMENDDYDDDEEWDDNYEDSEPETNEDFVSEQYRMVKYLLDNKDKIRDILIRVALKRADRLGGDHSLNRIQKLFQEAAKDAWIIFTHVR